MASQAQEEVIITLADSAQADSIAATDSIEAFSGKTLTRGIALESPAKVQQSPSSVATGRTDDGLSWITGSLLLVFVACCLRYRKNTRYFSLLLQNVADTRERHNAFDDTLRETSFIWLLNLLWCGSAGVVLYGAISPSGPLDIASMGICMAVCGVYTLFLTAAYSVVGNLFSDSGKASLWVKGFLSTQGLEAIAFFPAAMVALSVPGSAPGVAVFGAVVFIIAKILFIYKGFCIFFTEIASWVLFLYYLCSLEIVPVVLAYAAAVNWG